MDELIEAQDKYIKLLIEELDETVPIASIHGWKSSRFEIGKQMRNDIDMLKKVFGLCKRQKV